MARKLHGEEPVDQPFPLKLLQRARPCVPNGQAQAASGAVNQNVGVFQSDGATLSAALIPLWVKL
jgi:hypothetical protein